MSRENYIEHIIQSFITFRKGLIKDVHTVSHAQTDAMLCVFENKSVTVGELAHMLQITPGAATQLTNSLTKSEYIEREADNSDRRITRIKLSSVGEQALKKAKEQKLVKVRKILAPLSDEELQMLATLLGKVSKSVHEHKGE